MISRRQFGLALATPLAVPLPARAQSNALQARIKIDSDRRIGAIDPKIYGNFAEHLGRCIEGGLFEEGSPLSDSNGYRKDVRQAVKDLDVTLLRWPGGNFSSNYNWKDGIGPRDQRPARLEMAWGTVESNRFGTHEFLNYTEALGIEPYICANLGTGTWTDAQQWVEYCNTPDGTAMTKLRQQNGRKDPWKVKYWGLGNEMDGPWQMGHRTAEDYGKFALEAAKLMKWTDPNVQLIAAGSSNFGANADWVGWNREVLAYLKDHIEYLSLHTYVGNAANDDCTTIFLRYPISWTTGFARRAASSVRQPAARAKRIRSILPSMSGTFGIARVATHSAADAFWRSITTLRTPSSSRRC